MPQSRPCKRRDTIRELGAWRLCVPLDRVRLGKTASNFTFRGAAPDNAPRAFFPPHCGRAKHRLDRGGVRVHHAARALQGVRRPGRARMGWGRTDDHAARVDRGPLCGGPGGSTLLLGRHRAGMLRLLRTRAARMAHRRRTPAAHGGGDCVGAHRSFTDGRARGRCPLVAWPCGPLRGQRMDDRCSRHAPRGRPAPSRRSASRVSPLAPPSAASRLGAFCLWLASLRRGSASAFGWIDAIAVVSHGGKLYARRPRRLPCAASAGHDVGSRRGIRS
jgi:hypothetical protein